MAGNAPICVITEIKCLPEDRRVARTALIPASNSLWNPGIKCNEILVRGIARSFPLPVIYQVSHSCRSIRPLEFVSGVTALQEVA